MCKHIYTYNSNFELNTPPPVNNPIQPAQDPFLKDLLLKWLLDFKSRSFKNRSFCLDIVFYPTYPPKASLHKGDGLRPAPFVGNPLWRLAFGGYVGYRTMSRQKDLLLKDLLLESRSHFKSRSFKNGSCAGWIVPGNCG